MAKSKKQWVLVATKKNTRISDKDKSAISDSFVEMVESFKKKCLKENPDKRFNYLIDIYTSWYRNFFYLCEKYKSEFPDRIADEFEQKLVRLEYLGNDCFNFSYFRHTGQWHVVVQNISLEDCKEMILENPLFQPM